MCIKNKSISIMEKKLNMAQLPSDIIIISPSALWKLKALPWLSVTRRVTV